MDNNWENFKYTECLPYNMPSKKERFSKMQDGSKDGWIQSDDDWCKSCYNAYKHICKHVSYEFEIQYHEEQRIWNEKDLVQMINLIYKQTKNYDYNIWLNEYEPKMKSLIDCINTRFYHHKYCYRPLSDYERYPSMVSNKGHMRNITVMCSGLLKLYILYEKMLKEYNDNSIIKKKNLLLDLNSECADNCRNTLKSKVVISILKDLELSSKNVSKLETNSPRSYTTEKRSRRNKSYEISKRKIYDIISGKQ